MDARTERMRVARLWAEAENLVDRWGVPHTDAASRCEALFLRGFKAARDRPRQVDLWRKRGPGLPAADRGAA